MTNREYMESLSDEELAYFLNDDENNWYLDCWLESNDNNSSIESAIEYWLKQKHEENEFEF